MEDTIMLAIKCLRWKLIPHPLAELFVYINFVDRIVLMHK